MIWAISVCILIDHGLHGLHGLDELHGFQGLQELYRFNRPQGSMELMYLIGVFGFRYEFCGRLFCRVSWPHGLLSNLGFKTNFLYLLHSEHKKLSSWMDGMIVEYISATGAPEVLKTHKKSNQSIF